jgi:hypothetical protein
MIYQQQIVHLANTNCEFKHSDRIYPDSEYTHVDFTQTQLEFIHKQWGNQSITPLRWLIWPTKIVGFSNKAPDSTDKNA